MDVSSSSMAQLLAPPTLAVADRGQELDVGSLAIFDAHPLEGYAAAAARPANEAALLRNATENAQLLIKALFECPVQQTEDAGPVAVLPAATTRVPRAQHVPRPKPLTRWQKFALAKGISKKKKDARVVDEATGEAAPRWGFKRGREDGTKDWLIEAKAGDDPTVDLFEERKLKKKQRVLQNEISRVSNEQRAAYADEARSGGGVGAKTAPRPPALADLEPRVAGSRKAERAVEKREKREAKAMLAEGLGAGSAAGGAAGPGRKGGLEARKIVEEREASRRRAAAREAKIEGGRVPTFVPSGIPTALTMSEGAADGVLDNGRKARPHPGLADNRESKHSRDQRLAVAQVSTASMGRFDAALEGEPARKRSAKAERRLPNEVPLQHERQRHGDILSRVLHGSGEGEAAASAGAVGAGGGAVASLAPSGGGAGPHKSSFKKSGSNKGAAAHGRKGAHVQRFDKAFGS